jgi:hypothetical protein
MHFASRSAALQYQPGKVPVQLRSVNTFKVDHYGEGQFPGWDQ